MLRFSIFALTGVSYLKFSSSFALRFLWSDKIRFDAVQSAYEAGIINGKAPTSFAPNDKITRQQMAMLLARAFKLEEESAKEFSDVGLQKEAYSAVLIIHAFGITEGVTYTHFNPNR